MKNLEVYLRNNIDESAKIQRWNPKEYLSLQLAGMYEYYQVTLLSETFLLVRPLEEESILKRKVQLMHICEKTGKDVAVLLEKTSPYLLKKMFEERIPFLMKDKQMYLPFLALHIRKQKEKVIEETRKEKFTASTQMVYLKLLYSKKTIFGVEELAEELNLSSMTILRAVEELRKIGIVNCEIGGQTGRKKLIFPVDRKTFFKKGKEYLTNPIRQRINIKCLPDHLKIYKSGLTALGEQTMLGEPERTVYATFMDASKLEEYQVSREQALAEGLSEVQIMSYDIGKLTENHYVDPITLRLTLKEKDERIEIAFEELMGEYEWYEG